MLSIPFVPWKNTIKGVPKLKKSFEVVVCTFCHSNVKLMLTADGIG